MLDNINSHINIINLILFLLLLLPILSGAFKQFTKEGLQNSLYSLFDSLFFLGGAFLSIYLTKRIFFEHHGDIFNQIYNLIPANIRTVLYGQDVIIYLLAAPFILLLLLMILRPILQIILLVIIKPLAGVLYGLLSAGGPWISGFAGAMLQIPRAFLSVFLVGIILNFLAYYYPSPALAASINSSGLYRTLYQEVICPALNSNLAKSIPVIVNDAFAQVTEKNDSFKSDEAITKDWQDKAKSLMKGRVIEYFNGVTLETAVQSNDQINEKARQIVGNEKDNQIKAYLLYEWVAKNISYDYEKAAQIAKSPVGINSGSIVAFTERKGVCFDYSSLYVSMCRAVGLKVRLLTGQAYSGITWGDHAWNQVYIPEEDRWINVDATFGNTANYFDKADFMADHRSGEIQGEW